MNIKLKNFKVSQVSLFDKTLNNYFYFNLNTKVSYVYAANIPNPPAIFEKSGAGSVNGLVKNRHYGLKPL
jgi:hypothetical protein